MKSANYIRAGLGQTLAHANKEVMLSYLHKHPLSFESALHMLMEVKHPHAWKAAWLINFSMAHQDKRVQQHLKNLICLLPDSPDSLQREILKIILKMEVIEELEGMLFDHCIKAWKDINKKASLRFYAMKAMMAISQKHEGLKNEILHFLQRQYLDNLTPGIKSSVLKLSLKLQSQAPPLGL